MPKSFKTDVPDRLDRLPWTKFHWLLVSALGVTWVLDGLEATVVAAIGPVLLEASTLHLKIAQVGMSQSMYLAGAIGGAILFGHLADLYGRKRLFTVTLLIYLAGAALTAISWNWWSFALFRFVTGAAIGGEYSAINSAVDEFVPARLRGQVDLAINSTYWVGAMLGAGASVFLLDTSLLPAWLGWRLAFGLGAILGIFMIFARQFVPESPRWLLAHGRQAEANTIIHDIEEYATPRPRALPAKVIEITPAGRMGFIPVLRFLVVRYPGRCTLGLILIVSQAFFYNGISTSAPLILNTFYDVPAEGTGRFVLLMAAANLFGPLLLGRWFDTVGRRFMISATYAAASLVIVVGQVLFVNSAMNVEAQIALWMVTFFFASAGASAGYLTVSEVFPLEMRALAIALFFALGTAIGGLATPSIFAALVASGRRDLLAAGFLAGAVLMGLAAVTELVLGPAAEQKSLEDIATPLSAGGA